jgi:hypothetical protein
MVLVLIAAAVLFRGGLASRSPWPEVSSLLDSLCGPGRWTAGEVSYDPATSRLELASLKIEPGGRLELAASIEIGRLRVLLEGGDPSAGRLPRVELADLKTAIGGPEGPPSVLRIAGVVLEDLWLAPGSQARDQILAAAALARFGGLALEIPAARRPRLTGGSAEAFNEAFGDEGLEGRTPEDDHASPAELSIGSLIFPEGLTLERGAGFESGADFENGESLESGPSLTAPSVGLATLMARRSDLDGRIVIRVDAARWRRDPLIALTRLSIAKDDGGETSIESLEISGYALGENLVPEKGLSMLERAAARLAWLAPGELPLSLFIERPVSLYALTAEGLSAETPRGLAVSARRVEAEDPSGGELRLAISDLALAPADSDRAGLLFRTLADANLAPLTASMTLSADYSRDDGVWTVSVPDLEIAGSLASGEFSLTVEGLAPAALAALSLLTPEALGDPPEPALSDLGDIRLALDLKDKGLVDRLESGQAARLDLKPEAAAARLSDALELALTIRLDPIIANTKEISEALRAFLVEPGRLSVRAGPGEPSAPGLDPAPSLTLSINGAPPVEVAFRAAGAFDVDYTGEDSGLHPKASSPAP